MKLLLILFSLLLYVSLVGETIQRGTIDQRDILDALEMNVWAWDIKNETGFKETYARISIYQRDSNGEWRQQSTHSHGRASTDSRTEDSIVLFQRAGAFVLKVGNGVVRLDNVLDDFDLEALVFHDVGGVGSKTQDGYIIASQFIQRNRSTDKLEDRDFYVIVEIETDG